MQVCVLLNLCSSMPPICVVHCYEIDLSAQKWSQNCIRYLKRNKMNLIVNLLLKGQKSLQLSSGGKLYTWA